MKSYLKFLSRNKLYTLVNVVGLSVSLAFVIIIGLYAQMEFGRDKWHAKADRIYSICTESEGEVDEHSHWCMQGLLRSHFPEIENSCAVLNHDAELTIGNQEKKMVKMMAADSTFFQLFDFPLTLGNRRHALKQSNAIILSEETARLLFGNSDPMGKNVTLKDSLQFVVTGVMPQLNHTYMRKCDVLVSTDMADILTNNGGRFKDETMNSYGQCRVYLLAREGCDLRQKEAAINDFLSERIWLFKKDSPFPSRLELHPLKEMYFLKRGGDNGTSKGDHQLSWLLTLAGLVILLFAVMNYVNLTMAQSTFRMREMAMRRLLGSQRSAVMLRLIGESVVLCLLSLLIALLLVHIAEPYVNWLVNNHSVSSWEGNIASGDIDIIQTADSQWRHRHHTNCRPIAPAGTLGHRRLHPTVGHCCRLGTSHCHFVGTPHRGGARHLPPPLEDVFLAAVHRCAARVYHCRHRRDADDVAAGAPSHQRTVRLGHGAAAHRACSRMGHDEETRPAVR